MADNDTDAGTLPQPTGLSGGPTFRSAIVELLHPIPFTILLILTSVLLLIAANVMNLDAGNILARMSDHEFARGLITYLFAVTTIGTSVVLVLAALTGKLVKDEAYQRGKEILALLLGVFGTIVGFYFGSEAHEGVGGGELSVSQPLVSEATAVAGSTIRLTTYVNGGSPPYSYGLAVGESSKLEYQRAVDPNGWIVTDMVVPSVAEPSDVHVRVGVRDTTGKTVIKESVIAVRPPPAAK